ncbi:TetR/AcrR family transcriptional regulator [Leuconostocaceae bacterium ESL0958]|nr:TetR/AcrR family transcriptional regulator [Leuconostocaceae bacterium ESL0958]
MITPQKLTNTQQKILDTALDLLATVPFSKLSVTQLCKAAQIGRITFYKQFDDKYDVLQRLLIEVVSENLTVLNMEYFHNHPFEAFIKTHFGKRLITFQFTDLEFRAHLNKHIYRIIYDLTEDDRLVWLVFEVISIADWYASQDRRFNTKRDFPMLDTIIRTRSFQPTFS